MQHQPKSSPSIALAPKSGLMTVLGKEPTLRFVDPRSRRLEIERSAVTETAGLTKDETPTLCLLHMAGRCRLGARCRQIHADVAVVSKLRRAAVARPDCCASHGDSSREPVPANASVCVAGVTFSPSQLCMTAGLTRRARQWQSLKTADLCRVHLGGLCRHGEECRFLHVCREHVARNLSVAPMRSEVTCAPKVEHAIEYAHNPYGHAVVVEDEGDSPMGLSTTSLCSLDRSVTTLPAARTPPRTAAASVCSNPLSHSFFHARSLSGACGVSAFKLSHTSCPSGSPSTPPNPRLVSSFAQMVPL